MKKHIKLRLTGAIALILFLVSEPGIEAQTNTLNIDAIDVLSGNFSLDDGENNVSSQFGFSKFPVGDPDILSMSTLILIPNGAEVTISVSPGAYEVFNEGYVHPVQPRLLEGSEDILPPESAYINTSVYASSQSYPGVFYQLKRLGKIRGQEVGILYVFPFQYNPADEVTNVYKNLELHLTYDGEIESLPANLLSEFDPLETPVINYDPLETVVINYDQVTELEMNAASTLKSAASFEPGCDFLIITNESLAPAAERLKNYRISKGVETKVKTFSGSIVPSDIESYIDLCYSTMDPVPHYILLLGDVDIIPASDKIAGKTTDLPYFDIDDVAPRFADFSSGRIPVSTLSDANTWIDKIITYENIPRNENFFKNAALVSFFRPTQEASGTEYFRYIKTCEEMGTLFTFRNIGFDRLYYSTQSYIDKYTFIPSFLMSDDKLLAPIPTDIKLPNNYGFTWDNKNTEIIQSINEGKFLVIHRGHGSVSGWGTNNFLQFSTSDISSLNNTMFPSVIWSLNCLTGKFDGTSDCISEKLGKYATGGAVGIIAATGETETIYNDHLAHGLMQAIWPEFLELRRGNPVSDTGHGYLRLGDVLRNGLLHLLNAYQEGFSVDPGAMNHILAYHWLGDPTMEILPSTYCIPLRTIQNDTVNAGESLIYNNASEINIEGNFVVDSGGTVELYASNRIVFRQSVKINQGGYLQASLQDCFENVSATILKNTVMENYEEEAEKSKATEIEEFQNTLKAYPNPAAGIVNIEWGASVDDESLVMVYNTTGNLLLENRIRNNSCTIDISNYRSGIYFIRVLAGNSYYEQRLIKY